MLPPNSFCNTEGVPEIFEARFLSFASFEGIVRYPNMGQFGSFNIGHIILSVSCEEQLLRRSADGLLRPMKTPDMRQWT